MERPVGKLRAPRNKNGDDEDEKEEEEQDNLSYSNQLESRISKQAAKQRMEINEETRNEIREKSENFDSDSDNDEV